MNLFWHLAFLCRADQGRELGWKTHLLWDTGVRRTRYVIILTKSTSRQKKIIVQIEVTKYDIEMIGFICRALL